MTTSITDNTLRIGYMVLILLSCKTMTYAKTSIKYDMTADIIHVLLLSFKYVFINGIGAAAAVAAIKYHIYLFLSSI